MEQPKLHSSTKRISLMILRILFGSFVVLSTSKHTNKATTKTTTTKNMADPKEELNWDTHAKAYDKNIRRLTSLHASDLIGSILPQIRSAKTILDVGSGTGAFGHAYLDFFPEGIPGQKLILSDLSPGMIKQAEQSMLAKLPSNFQTEIEFRVEDGTDLKGIDTDSIDIVISVFGAFLIPDREKVLEAVARVLVKGGIFANVSWSFISVPVSL